MKLILCLLAVIITIHGSLAKLKAIEYETDSQEVKKEFIDKEGDLAFNPKQKLRQWFSNNPVPAYRRWTNGKVPYVLSNDYNDQEKRLIRKWFSQLNRQTRGCVQFVPRRNERLFVDIIKSTGCFAYVGMQRNNQYNKLSLGRGCLHGSIIKHEALHTLGFSHEQSRSDRDKYVRIVEQNMPDTARGQFRKESRTNNEYSPFDYWSVMMYAPTAFSNNGRPTIESRRRGVKLERNLRMTGFDVARVRQLYSCR